MKHSAATDTEIFLQSWRKPKTDLKIKWLLHFLWWIRTWHQNHATGAPCFLNTNSQFANMLAYWLEGENMWMFTACFTALKWSKMSHSPMFIHSWFVFHSRYLLWTSLKWKSVELKPDWPCIFRIWKSLVDVEALLCNDYKQSYNMIWVDFYY